MTTMRRAVLAVLALIATVVTASAQNSEPTYTARFSDKQTAHLALQSATDDKGIRHIRIANRRDRRSDLLLEADLDADNNLPTYCRVRYGKMPIFGERPPYLTHLEAKPVAGRNALQSRQPAEDGEIGYTGTVIGMPSALISLGKLYNFAQGGVQRFVFLLDFNYHTTITYDLTLEADGKETIDLAGVKAVARRLKYHAFDAPNLGKDQQNGVIYIGASGEILRCDHPIFQFPILAKSVAKRTDDTITLPYDIPGKVTTEMSKSLTGWDVRFTLGGNKYPLASALLDGQFRPTFLKSPWRGRNETVTITGDTIRWHTEPSGWDEKPISTGNIWLLPFWFATDLWESENAPFAMAVEESREGTYFPLFTGQRDGNPFTIRRLADVEKVHRYRFSGKNVYDVYTDGARLILFTGSDGTTITRDGWEDWANGIAAPQPPKSVEKAK